MSYNLILSENIGNMSELESLSHRVCKIVINSIVLLEGDVGSGKTTFVKMLAERLGITGVSSPSYNIYNIYSSIDYSLPFYHFDLYRISSVEELDNIGFFELIENNSVITAIEWASPLKLDKYLPEKHFKITIDLLDSVRVFNIYESQ